MEHLIKKINMIDILGMLLPGGLMLLLLEQDINWMRDLSNYLGIKAGDLLIAMIFLCGSYAVGMLLHEMGSAVEKLMWKNPFFNPSIWAAVNTGLADRYNKDGTLQDPKENTYGKTTETKANNSVFRNCFNTVPALLTGVVVFGIFPLGVRLWSLGIYIVFVIGLVLVCTWRHGENAKLVLLAYKNETTIARLEWIENNRATIEEESYISEEHGRKRGLFNGYYSMARSLIMMMALLQCYACLQSNKESSFMMLVGKINENPAYIFLWMTVAVLLMSRYWHYACTRFSYTYNGFIRNKENPEKYEYKIVEKTREIQFENGVEQKNIEQIKWIKK